MHRRPATFARWGKGPRRKCLVVAARVEFGMKTPDSHSLVETYRRMSDGELLHLAADIVSLTDAARAALDEELNARKLEPAVPGEIEATSQPSLPEDLAPARSTAQRNAAITTTGIILLAFSTVDLLILAWTPIILWSRLPHNTWPLVLKLKSFEFPAVLVLWGIATAIGILLLRPWARVSGALICSLGAYGGLAALMGGLVTWPTILQRYGRETTIMAIGTVLIFVGIGCLGALGISVLNSESARLQFGGDSPIPADERPLTMTCIGIVLVGAWPLTLLLNLLKVHLTLLTLPSIPFASFLSGRMALLFQYVMAGVAVALGVGILRMKSWARIGFLGLCVAAFLNALSLLLKPDITAVGAILRDFSVSRAGVAGFSLLEAGPFVFAAWLLMKRSPNAR